MFPVYSAFLPFKLYTQDNTMCVKRFRLMLTTCDNDKNHTVRCCAIYFYYRIKISEMFSVFFLMTIGTCNLSLPLKKNRILFIVVLRIAFFTRKFGQTFFFNGNPKSDGRTLRRRWPDSEGGGILGEADSRKKSRRTFASCAEQIFTVHTV